MIEWVSNPVNPKYFENENEFDFVNLFDSEYVYDLENFNEKVNASVFANNFVNEN